MKRLLLSVLLLTALPVAVPVLAEEGAAPPAQDTEEVFFFFDDEESTPEAAAPPDDLLERWMRETVIEAALRGGAVQQRTRRDASRLRTFGQPPQGLVLEAGTLDAYLGSGWALAAQVNQPFARDQYGAVQLREYGRWQMSGEWWTQDTVSFPLDTDSRWHRSYYALSYTPAPAWGLHGTRTHLARHGMRSTGTVNAAMVTTSLTAPFRIGERGTASLMLQQEEFTDHSGRLSDRERLDLRGNATWRLAPSRQAALAIQQQTASVEAIAGEQRTRHLAVAYSDRALGGDPAWRWDVRGSRQETEQTIQRSWVPSEEWTVGSTLTWAVAPWQMQLGYTQSERDRFRLSPEAMQELVLDPEREAFDRGVYLPSTTRQAQWDAAVRWQPDRRRRARLRYRAQQHTGLPLTSLVTDETGTPNPPLWANRHERWIAEYRQTVRPGVHWIMQGLDQSRRWSGRDAQARYRRADIAWHDASREIAWWGRLGVNSTRSAWPAGERFSQTAWLLGAGFAAPVDSQQHWMLHADCSTAQASGATGYDEWVAAVALSWTPRPGWSLEARTTLHWLDLDQPRGPMDAQRQEWALLWTHRW